MRGVIYVRSVLNAELITNFTAPDSIAFYIATDIGKLGIAVIYRSQNLSKIQDESLLFEITKLCQSENFAEVLVLGDLNMSDTNWVTGSVNGPINSKNEKIIMQNNYLDAFVDLGLSWSITNQEKSVSRKISLI